MKKNIFSLLLATGLVFVFMSCESSKSSKKNTDSARENEFKTSTYGGCDFKTECWDYTGSAFKDTYATAQLKSQCAQSKGTYVENGCTYKNLVTSCKLNSGTSEEQTLHVYLESGSTKEDVQMLCEAQSGVIVEVSN